MGKVYDGWGLATGEDDDSSNERGGGRKAGRMPECTSCI